MQQLVDIFFVSAKKNPKTTALRYFDKQSQSWLELTWEQYEERVRKLAGWLLAQGTQKGDRIAIISPNRPEWLIADLAILAVGAVSVPIYATASHRDIKYILEHSESKVVFVPSVSAMGDKVRLLEDFKSLITFDPIKSPPSSTLTDLGTILASEVVPLKNRIDVKSDDLASIIYTSGTTGIPKGVVHTHGTIMATTKPVITILELDRIAPDRFFSFLPLSHVAERVLVEFGSVCTAAEVTFARSVDSLVEDLALFPPTILLCVPRLWERIHERIRNGLVTANPIKKFVFALASRAGTARIEGNRIIKANDKLLGAKIADALVGKKLRTRLGMDQVRLFLTGSAPTPPDVLKFFGCFGIFIREVYGLTENFCLGVYTAPDAILIGHCGKIFPGNQVKTAADGEIMFKAPWNFIGYYKDSAATKEVLSDDGWFSTGDLGSIDNDGQLRITGRKKELLKTSTGKYVAQVPIEDTLKELPLITDAMIVGDNQKYCIALVALDPAADSYDPAVVSALTSHLSKVNANLAHHENIMRFGIMKAGFSLENDTLTPTLKLKRKVVVTEKEKLINNVYASSDLIVREA